MERAEGLDPGAKGVDAVPAHEAGRAVGVQLRGPFDVRLRHAGELRGAARGIPGRPLGQRVEAVAPAGDEVSVVAVVQDQPVDHCQADGGVGAGPGPQPQVGHGGRGRLCGVDDHHTRASASGAFEGLPLGRVGGCGVAPDHERAAGVVDVLAVAHGESRNPVAEGAAPAAQVLVHHPVGRPQGPQQQRHHDAAAEMRVADRAAQRRGAVPAADAQHGVGHLVQRLVPGQAPPSPAAPGPGAFHGVEHPVWMVGQLRQPADALDAERPPGRRMVRIGRDPGHAPVLHRDQRPAMGAALPTGARDDLAFVHGVPFRFDGAGALPPAPSFRPLYHSRGAESAFPCK